MNTTTTSGAADLPEALIGAIMAAAYDFRDAHISGSKNLKRTAHAELESTVRNTLHALAAGQATAAQVVAYAALPDEREMLKHALWLASSFTVHRYLISNAEGRWSGAEKATCHDELCCLYVAVFRGAEVDRVRVDFEEDWVAVHDATQELTDHMDVVIGFPLKGVPDYESLAPKFFAHFHRLATRALRASHGQAPAWAGEAAEHYRNAIARARLLDSDLSKLTERGAKAWAGVDAQGLRDGGASTSANAGRATAAQAVVPAGWKLVPEQPTLPMLIKGSDTDTSTSAEDCRRVYRAMLAAAPAQPATQQGVAYAALPESFLEIPDVQDESGINAYYSREVVLECIDAALASHGQASVPPPECETEAEKRAFAFGWFKALESERMKADNKKKDQL